jgi:hypothetical protein
MLAILTMFVLVMLLTDGMQITQRGPWIRFAGWPVHT